MRLRKGSSEIKSVSDWFKLAPPKKGALQWKDGRSAKELAKAWCGIGGTPSPPKEFLDLMAPLATADQLGNAIGWPEHQVPIDKLLGESPNIDLAIICDGLRGKTAICVEAKADEPFGEYASTVYNAAATRIGQGIKTGSLTRLEYLEELLLPEADPGLPGREEIRYQLLTGTAAALTMAKKYHAPVAVFVVHEFLFVGHVDEQKIQQNKLDLSQFVTRLTRGSITAASEGVLLKPLSPPSPKADWGGASLYIGKVITRGTIANS